MLYLSRLKLNVRHQNARRDMEQPYELHRTLENAFHNPTHSDERVLFRLDYRPREREWWVLVQSRYAPDWSFFQQPERQGYLLADPEVRAFEPELLVGGVYKFRLLANPTVKKDREGKKQGNRIGLYEEKEQIAWLTRKFDASGAEILDCIIIPKGDICSRKGIEKQQGKQTHLAILFEGVLRANNSILLQQALGNGIGSAKGFGFGLLSLAPVRG